MPSLFHNGRSAISFVRKFLSTILTVSFYLVQFCSIHLVHRVSRLLQRNPWVISRVRANLNSLVIITYCLYFSVVRRLFCSVQRAMRERPRHPRGMLSILSGKDRLVCCPDCCSLVLFVTSSLLQLHLCYGTLFGVFDVKVTVLLVTCCPSCKRRSDQLCFEFHHLRKSPSQFCARISWRRAHRPEQQSRYRRRVCIDKHFTPVQGVLPVIHRLVFNIVPQGCDARRYVFLISYVIARIDFRHFFPVSRGDPNDMQDRTPIACEVVRTDDQAFCIRQRMFRSWQAPVYVLLVHTCLTVSFSVACLQLFAISTRLSIFNLDGVSRRARWRDPS